MEKNSVHTPPFMPSNNSLDISKFPSSIPPKNHIVAKIITTKILQIDNTEIVDVPFIAAKKSCNNAV